MFCFARRRQACVTAINLKKLIFGGTFTGLFHFWNTGFSVGSDLLVDTVSFDSYKTLKETKICAY
jgi:hypothetical protein